MHRVLAAARIGVADAAPETRARASRVRVVVDVDPIAML
jgi:hypothetical protein